MPQGNGPARREAGRGARGGPRTPQFINKYSGRAETTIGNAAQDPCRRKPRPATVGDVLTSSTRKSTKHAAQSCGNEEVLIRIRCE